MGAAEDAVAALDQMPAGLAAAYRRPAHQGRLEQIARHIAGLRSLIAQLPGEEAREADWAERLLALHDGGTNGPRWPESSKAMGKWDPAEHSHEAQQRLAWALAERGDGEGL